MKKILTPRNVLLALVALIIVVASVAYFARGWIRASVIPSYVANAKAQTLKDKVDTELTALGQPFNLLGYASPEKQSTSCKLSYAKAFRTDTLCTYRIDASRVITGDETARQQFRDDAKKLQDALQGHHWHGNYSEEYGATPLTTFVGKLSRGDDSTPDATYSKEFDGIKCELINVAASSSPAPAAMATHLTCTQTFRTF